MNINRRKFLKLGGISVVVSFMSILAHGITSRSQQLSGAIAERFRRMSREAEARGLAEPFKGITTNGDVVSGLFPIRSTGVSTVPVRGAAEAFLATLTPKQRYKKRWVNRNTVFSLG